MRYILLNLLAGLLSAQTVSFLAPRTFVDASLPTAIISGDFNNDGMLDVVVTGFDGYDFFAGNGRGAFRPPIGTSNGLFSQTVAADFNGDGNLDLASIDSPEITTTVTVSLGNGDGTFQPGIAYSLPTAPSSLAVGDFNNDGIPDLALSNGATISVLLGRGDGTFRPVINSPANGSILGIAAGDLNGDGNLDLATLDASGTGPCMQVFIGNGRGSFSLGSSVPVNYNLLPVIAIGDLRNNGILDVVAVTGDETLVFVGNGNGTFLPAVTYPIPDGDSIAIADVNRDGKLDLLVGDYYTDGVSVLLGNGDGTFQAASLAGAGVLVQGVAAGDFNGDGIADFVTANGGSDSITVFLGDKHARFNAPNIAVSSANAIAAADFNGDGNLDFAVSNIIFGVDTSQVFLYLGDRKGGFHQSDVVTVPDSGWLISGDFNRDGKADLVTLGDKSISVLLGNGRGQLGPPRGFPVATGGGTGLAADFNRDGKLDLAIAATYGNQLAIMLGNGDGTFQAPVLIPIPGQPHGILSGDVNGDGIADLVVTCQNTNEVAVLLGKGDGSFQSPVYYPTGEYPQYVAIGDVNGDGKTDLAVSNTYSNDITLLLGNGDGTFQTGFSLLACPYGCFPRAIEILDLNGDGKMDLAVAAQETDALAVLLGNGDGTFFTPHYFGTEGSPINMATGRFSGRQIPDALLVSPLGVSVLLNTSP